jgi:hypothetical protein
MKIAVLAIAASLAVLAAGPLDAAAPKPLVACKLLRVADVAAVLGSPVALHKGGTTSECIIRGGDKLPIVMLANSSGKRGFTNLMRAQGPPFAKVRNLGTQAVSYDHLTDDPQGVQRGVIVRKDNFIVQLSTSDVGMEPPGLPTVAMLVKLARAAVKRL